MINMEENYKKLIEEFLEGAFDEESKLRFNSAISNYYKSLTTLCSLIIYRKSGKIANSHQEVDMFMSFMFHDIRKKIEGLYKTYTGTYQMLKEKKDCTEIKNGIKTVIIMAGLEKEFEQALAKLSTNN